MSTWSKLTLVCLELKSLLLSNHHSLVLGWMLQFISVFGLYITYLRTKISTFVLFRRVLSGFSLNFVTKYKVDQNFPKKKILVSLSTYIGLSLKFCHIGTGFFFF